MSILVDGIDCGGKSTIENKLQQKLGWNIVKGSSFELAECTNEELFDHFKNIAISTKNLIVDRFIYSNFLYAAKFTDYARLTQEQFNYVQSLLEARNATIVYVRANPEVIIRRLRNRGDEYIKEGDIVGLLNDYDRLFHNARFKYIEVDTTNGIPEDTINFLVSLA